MTDTTWVLDPPTTITTKRLVLRRFGMDDALALAAHLDNIEISKWVTTMPHPYTVDDARWFIENLNGPLVFAITLRETGDVIGSVGLKGEIGYWLAPTQWGKGIMKEATTAVITYWFNQTDDPMVSGYFVGNERSASVLYHHGFVDDRRITQHCRALDRDVPCQRLILTKAAWLSRQTR